VDAVVATTSERETSEGGSIASRKPFPDELMYKMSRGIAGTTTPPTRVKQFDHHSLSSSSISSGKGKPK
jgi:hypothetical protein